jgi:aspartate aminotransferase
MVIKWKNKLNLNSIEIELVEFYINSHSLIFSTLLMFSATVSTLRSSPIQVMAERTRQAMQAGQSVVDMTLGEPDFPTPVHICEAAAQAISKGQTRYTPINGSVPLREAIVRKFARDNGIECTVADINVGCGGKQVIYQAFVATLNPGDEVLIPAPYWASYADMVAMNGGVLRALMTSPERAYALSAAELDAAITPRTKWLVLNSPSNPSGTAYSLTQLQEFAQVIRQHKQQDFLIMVDDM